MDATHSLSMRLSDLPLWRLLVALDDAERVAGPDSPTARVLAHAVRERLRGKRRVAAPKDAPSTEGANKREGQVDAV